jgi:hypothetical protein
MKYTVRIKGTADLGEWKLDDVNAGRAGDSVGAAAASYPRRYEGVDADTTKEAADQVRAKLAADDTIDELWVLIPDDGSDVFDRQGNPLRHEDTHPSESDDSDPNG